MQPPAEAGERAGITSVRRRRPGWTPSQLGVQRLFSASGAIRTLRGMTATMIGYARCSTDEQDLTAQRQLLLGLGVAPDRIYLDDGLTSPAPTVTAPA